MPQPQVNITQTTGGLGRQQYTNESISGLVLPGVDTANYTVGEIIQLTSARQLATQYSIDKAYDDSNGLLVYHHVKEFFRMCPSAKLWFMLVPAGIHMEDICDPAQNFAAALLLAANGEIMQLGIGGDEGLAETVAAVPMAQNLVDSEFSNYRYLSSVLLEGRAFNTSAALATDLRGLAARKVSVVIAQDLAVANDTLNPQANYAAVGTTLGTIAQAVVHESIGWVGRFNLLGSAGNEFYYPGLSSNIGISAYTTADLDILHDKGYLLARTFANYSGTFFNSSPTAIALSDDYYCIEYNRVWVTAARTVRLALLPHLNSPLRVDDNGRLHYTQKAMLETLVRSSIEQKMTDNLSELRSVVVDPAFDENAQPYPSILLDSTLRVLVAIVPMGKAEQILVSIGFINPSNA